MSSTAGQIAWIEHLIDIAREGHELGYPREYFEVRALIDWIHDDCVRRWGATIEDVSASVMEVLNGRS